MAVLVWDQFMSSAEKRKLGNNLERQYQKHGLIGMWMKLRKLPQDAALVDLGYRTNLITPAEKDGFDRVLDLAKTPAPEPDRPKWDAIRGRLYWGATVIRVVKPAKRSRVRTILNTFSKRGWPAEIDDPLPGPSDGQRLHQAVFSLNRGLTRIRFHVSAAGTKLYWVSTAGSTSDR